MTKGKFYVMSDSQLVQCVPATNYLEGVSLGVSAGLD